jgi:hypothetical protein
VRWASSKARSGTANWSRRSSRLCGEARSATYAYCLPLSRFCSYVVLSRASGESPLATRPWPGGEKRSGGRTSHRTDVEAIASFLLPCTAAGVSLLAVWRRIGATPRGQPWTPAVTLPHGCAGLNARRMAVLWTFREPSLCRHVRREFMRNA